MGVQSCLLLLVVTCRLLGDCGQKWAQPFRYQKPRCSSCRVIETHNFKILPFFLHGYHTSQLKNIAIPAMFSHPTISKF